MGVDALSVATLLHEETLAEALAGLAPEEITGPGGLMTQLAGRVLETAFGAELSEHLGSPQGQAPLRRLTTGYGAGRTLDGR